MHAIFQKDAKMQKQEEAKRKGTGGTIFTHLYKGGDAITEFHLFADRRRSQQRPPFLAYCRLATSAHSIELKMKLKYIEELVVTLFRSNSKI